MLVGFISISSLSTPVLPQRRITTSRFAPRTCLELEQANKHLNITVARNFYKKYFIIALFVLVVIFLNSYLLNNFLQRTFYKFISKSGVIVNNYLLNWERFSNGFLKTKNIVESDVKLKEENDFLRGQLAELENLKRENQYLRNELGVAGRFSAQLLIAQIFNIQRGVLSSTALINKGTSDGIKKTMPLITAGNILVGIVDQVFDNQSRVLLLDDPRVKVSGRVQGSNIIVGVRGKLENRLGLDLVTASEDVKGGETIITSGLDGLPEAMPIAMVTKVENSGGSLFKTVTAKPIFDYSLGSSLFVILR